MDWIAQLFGISPDGGDGTLEFAFAVVIATVLAVDIWLIRRVVRRKASR